MLVAGVSEREAAASVSVAPAPASSHCRPELLVKAERQPHVQANSPQSCSTPAANRARCDTSRGPALQLAARFNRQARVLPRAALTTG
jgi:hypothetical protein